jgi:hypothetical protein
MVPLQFIFVQFPTTVTLSVLEAKAPKFYRVLTMVYNTQNYWIFVLCPSSGILVTRKHDVSETGSVSALR